MISEQCAAGAAVLAAYRQQTGRPVPVSGATFKKALKLHRSCVGCTCQCKIPEASNGDQR